MNDAPLGLFSQLREMNVYRQAGTAARAAVERPRRVRSRRALYGLAPPPPPARALPRPTRTRENLLRARHAIKRLGNPD